jgi:hypothetical protein
MSGGFGRKIVRDFTNPSIQHKNPWLVTTVPYAVFADATA